MKNLCLIIVYLIGFCGLAQNDLKSVANNFINSNQVFDNFAKEKFFLHLNKTIYFSGENLKYKAYVVDDNTNMPSSFTTNLHLSIYDFNKKLIKHQLVFVDKGISNSSVNLDKTLKTGTYYLVLDTNYNSSFNKKYVRKIQIVNLADKRNNSILEEEKAKNSGEVKEGLQVEFFPESNMLLSRAKNTLYFKISYNGKPLKTNGELIKKGSGYTKAKFSSNSKGLGIVNFDYYPQSEYYFKIRFQEKDYVVDVPNSVHEGFVIHLNKDKIRLGEVNFIIRTNNFTSSKFHSENVIVVIHRNNTCKSVIPFTINKSINNYSIQIEAENLFNGINNISIFNKEYKPISSRTFFYDKKKNIELDIKKLKETKDSLILDIQMLNRFTKANSSISILPSRAKINSNSLYNDFLISPYINNITSIHQIDQAIQVEDQRGSILDSKKNKVNIKNVENGISLTGEVITKTPNLKGFQVLLSSNDNNISRIIKIENGNKFSFKNLLFYYPSRFTLALLTPSGKVVKSEFKVNEQKLEYSLDSLIEVREDKIVENDFIENDDYINVSEEEKLDEVYLFGKNKKEKLKDSFDEVGYLNNPKEINNGFVRKIKKNKIECSDCTLFEYLDQISDLRTVIDSKGDYHLYYKTRGINTIFGSINALLIVDGKIMSDLNALSDFWARDVKSVKLNRSGAGYGIRGSNGVVEIELKTGKDYMDSYKTGIEHSKSNIFYGETSFGFTKKKDFLEKDNIIFNSQSAREEYATIKWIPNFTLLPNSSNIISISKDNYKEIKLIINGINDEGDIIHKEENISFSF